MNNARIHLQEGRLDDAIEALGNELRREPSHAEARTFLFELLCFTGQFARAEKQLAVLSEESDDSRIGCGVLRDALAAHQQREARFTTTTESPEPDLEEGPPVILNGEAVHSLADEDTRVGVALEAYVAGSYLRIPFSELEEVTAEAPTTLRDLLWFPAELRYAGGQAVAAHLPALAPRSWEHPDPEVRLGRASVLEPAGIEQPIPFGAKLLICDQRYVPLVDLRSLRPNAR